MTTAVLAATVLIGTAGCNMIAPQATLKQYDASDGIGTNVGSLDIRNALIIADGKKNGVLAVTVINQGDKPQDLLIEYPGGSVTVEVKASGSTAFGVGKESGILLEGLTTPSGADAAVFFQYADETGSEVRVPVLDPVLEEYSNLTPEPIPSSSATVEIDDAVDGATEQKTGH
ncbi:hypothetical protein [Mycetocola spongiae]|uniref:hypothetical protein n=1 Tax=Mycetocola spongiae TaxID=2859226 RepID=UPI001CF4B019|nr:hypothetical protein [Mycetocola spongiae]UCR88774.1 hypothetical protein KXZ72_12570 [Mycetocola spongiae]